MLYCILIHNNNSYKIKWEKFKTDDNKLILITDSKSRLKLAENKQSAFLDECVILSDNFRDFTFSNLKPLLDEIIIRHGIKNSEMRIATISEKDSSVCAELRNYYNVKGDKPADVEPFRNKIVMKEVLSRSSKTEKFVPKFFKFDYLMYKKNEDQYFQQIINVLQPPYFVKPLYESSSRGTAVLKSKIELKKYLISLTSDYDIEEFIEGVLYHCDSVVLNGVIIHFFAAEYLNPAAFCSIEMPSGSMLLQKNDLVYMQLEKFNCLVLQTMLKRRESAVTHLECFRLKTGEIRFIEIAKRPPGPLIPEMYLKAYGINLYEIGWAIQLGFPPEIECKHNCYVVNCFIPKPTGKLVKKNSLSHLKSEIEIEWFVKENEVITEGMETPYSRIGELLLFSNNYEELRGDFNKLKFRPGFYEIEPILTVSNHQKKLLFTYVIVRRGTVLEDWKKIKSEIKANLLMICNARIFEMLHENNFIECFGSIFITENFSFKNLDNIVKKYKLDKLKGHLRFVTSNESNLLAVSQLNSLYADSNCKFIEENVIAYLNKCIMKEKLGRDIRYPKYIQIMKNEKVNINTVLSAVKDFRYPLIIKPITESDSINVKKIDNKNELERWFLELSSESENAYEIDEFINGELYHCDSIISNGKIILTFVSRYCYPCVDFLSGKPNGSIPLCFNTTEYEQLKTFAESALKKLPNLENVVTHMEVFFSDGQCYFLEVAGRPGGGGIIETYQKTYGINIADINFRVQLGLSVEPLNLLVTKYHAWLNIPIKPGYVHSKVSLLKLGDCEVEISWLVEEGQLLHSSTCLSDIACKIRLAHVNYDSLLQAFNTVRQIDLFTTTSQLNILTPKLEMPSTKISFGSITKLLSVLLIKNIIKITTKDSLFFNKTNVILLSKKNILQQIFNHFLRSMPRTYFIFDGFQILVGATKDTVSLICHSFLLEVAKKQEELISFSKGLVFSLKIPFGFAIENINYFFEKIIFDEPELMCWYEKDNLIFVNFKEKCNESIIKLVKHQILLFFNTMLNPFSSFYSISKNKPLIFKTDLLEWKKLYNRLEIEEIEKFVNLLNNYSSSRIYHDGPSAVMRSQANDYRRFLPLKNKSEKIISLNTGSAPFQPFYSNATSFSDAITQNVAEEEYAKYALCIPNKQTVDGANAFLHHHKLLSKNEVLNDRKLVLVNGTVQAFYMLLSCILKPGDWVLMPRPNYGIFMPQIYDFGGNIAFVDLEDDYKISPQQLDCAIKYYNKKILLSYLNGTLTPKLIRAQKYIKSKTIFIKLPKLPTEITYNTIQSFVDNFNQTIRQYAATIILADQLILPPLPCVRAYFHTNPHNPSGATYSQNEVNFLARSLSQWPHIVIIDDIVHYGIMHDLNDFGVFAKTPKMVNDVLSLFSPSKSFCQANIRSGIAYGSEKYILAMQDKLSDTTTTISLPAQKAILNLFYSNPHEVKFYLNENNKEYFKRKQIMSLLLYGYRKNLLSTEKILYFSAVIYKMVKLNYSRQYCKEITAKLLAGLGGFNIVVNPQGSFFFLTSVREIIGLRIGPFYINSTFDLRHALCFFCLINVLPGELSANDDKMTLRINFTRNIEDIIETFIRLHKFLFLLRDENNQRPKFVTSNIFEWHRLNTNQQLFTKLETLASFIDNRNDINPIASLPTFFAKKYASNHDKNLDVAFARVMNLFIRS